MFSLYYLINCFNWLSLSRAFFPTIKSVFLGCYFWMLSSSSSSFSFRWDNSAMLVFHASLATTVINIIISSSLIFAVLCVCCKITNSVTKGSGWWFSYSQERKNMLINHLMNFKWVFRSKSFLFNCSNFSPPNKITF